MRAPRPQRSYVPCAPGLRVFVHALAGLCVLLAWAPERARAQLTHTVLAADGSFNLPIKAPYAAGGPGFAARLGARIGLPGAVETFELGFDYASFGSGEGKTQSRDVREFRGIGGVRLSLEGVVKPGLFAHLGVGRMSGFIATAGSSGLEPLSHTAFTWDGGAFLDFALGSVVELGIQASYNQVIKASHPRSLQWLGLAAHLQLVL